MFSLLNEASYSKFVKRKRNSVNDQSNKNYDVGNDIINNTEVLISNFYDYTDVYILAFKNLALFVKWTTKIDGITIDDAEYLDLVMPMYNLVKYSSNYPGITSCLWFYYKDAATNFW